MFSEFLHEEEQLRRRKSKVEGKSWKGQITWNHLSLIPKFQECFLLVKQLLSEMIISGINSCKSVQYLLHIAQGIWAIITASSWWKEAQHGMSNGSLYTCVLGMTHCRAARNPWASQALGCLSNSFSQSALNTTRICDTRGGVRETHPIAQTCSSAVQEVWLQPRYHFAQLTDVKWSRVIQEP